MKVALIVLLACIIVALGARHSKASRMPHEVRFQAWMEKYNKVYATQVEYETRLANFIATTKNVAALNAESKTINSTATFAINKFADLTPEEFAARLGMKGYVPTFQDGSVAEPTTQAAPNSFDWRTQNKVTPVKDQGQCGSCWAFSCTESIESVYVISKGINGNQMPALAPQQIVDCDKGDAGCNGGDLPSCYKYVIGAGGLEKESDYPYHARDGACQANKGLDYVHISNFKYVIPSGNKDENNMAAFLAANSPISIIVDASKWSSYHNGVIAASQCGHNLDHAVQAVGYDLGQGYWIVRNSWGADWGENGYLRLQFGKDTCGMTSEVTVPVL
jgi:C1A family cysteine protease